MGASFLVDYALQLTVMQPALLPSQLERLSQHNPHGAFIGVENVGYALLAGAFAPPRSCPGYQSVDAAAIRSLGLSATPALLLRSVSRETIKRAHCPVAVVHLRTRW